MFLNVLKGSYPGLQQVCRTLPMVAGQTGIERGSLLKATTAGWEKATSADKGSGTTPGAFVYICLMPQNDLVAGMAGNVGQGIAPASGKQPVLTALAIQPTQQIETDMYVAADNLAVGDWCTVGDGGKFGKAADNDTAIARVDVAPTSRWVNNAIAVTGWRTGGPLTVITLTTMYIPNLQLA